MLAVQFVQSMTKCESVLMAEVFWFCFCVSLIKRIANTFIYLHAYKDMQYLPYKISECNTFLMFYHLKRIFILETTHSRNKWEQ